MQCKCGGEMSPWRENKDGTRIAKCSGCTRVAKKWVTGPQPQPQGQQEQGRRQQEKP